jgi:hypothetical protein
MKIINLTFIIVFITVILLSISIIKTKSSKEKFNFSPLDCIDVLNNWWKDNVVSPFNEGKIKEEQVKQAYENIQPIKAWLIAPCISSESLNKLSIQEFKNISLDNLENFKNKILEEWKQHFILNNIDQAEIDEKEKIFMKIYNIEFEKNFKNKSNNLCQDCIGPLYAWHEKNIKNNSSLTDEKKEFYNKILIELSIWLAGPCVKKLWSKDILSGISEFSFEDIELLNNQIKTWWLENIFNKYKTTPEQYQGILKMFMHEIEICD